MPKPPRCEPTQQEHHMIHWEARSNNQDSMGWCTEISDELLTTQSILPWRPRKESMRSSSRAQRYSQVTDPTLPRSGHVLSNQLPSWATPGRIRSSSGRLRSKLRCRHSSTARAWVKQKMALIWRNPGQDWWGSAQFRTRQNSVRIRPAGAALIKVGLMLAVNHKRQNRYRSRVDSTRACQF